MDGDSVSHRYFFLGLVGRLVLLDDLLLLIESEFFPPPRSILSTSWRLHESPLPHLLLCESSYVVDGSREDLSYSSPLALPILNLPSRWLLILSDSLHHLLSELHAFQSPILQCISVHPVLLDCGCWLLFLELTRVVMDLEVEAK